MATTSAAVPADAPPTAADQVDHAVVRENDFVVLKDISGERHLRQIKGDTMRLGRSAVPAMSLVGMRYGETLGRLDDGGWGAVEPVELGVVDEDGEDGAEAADSMADAAPVAPTATDQERIGCNKFIKQEDRSVQALSDADISKMKAAGDVGKMISTIVSNSESFSQKTVFSQRKYVMKKQKKHVEQFTINPVSHREVCETQNGRWEHAQYCLHQAGCMGPLGDALWRSSSSSSSSSGSRPASAATATRRLRVVVYDGDGGFLLAAAVRAGHEVVRVVRAGQTNRGMSAFAGPNSTLQKPQAVPLEVFRASDETLARWIGSGYIEGKAEPSADDETAAGAGASGSITGRGAKGKGKGDATTKASAKRTNSIFEGLSEDERKRLHRLRKQERKEERLKAAKMFINCDAVLCAFGETMPIVDALHVLHRLTPYLVQGCGLGIVSRGVSLGLELHRLLADSQPLNGGSGRVAQRRHVCEPTVEAAVAGAQTFLKADARKEINEIVENLDTIVESNDSLVSDLRALCASEATEGTSTTGGAGRVNFGVGHCWLDVECSELFRREQQVLRNRCHPVMTAILPAAIGTVLNATKVQGDSVRVRSVI